MNFNLSQRVALDFNPVTRNATLILGARIVSTKPTPGIVYTLDSIMFQDFVDSLTKDFDLTVPGSMEQSKTIKDGMVGSANSITIKAVSDSFIINFRGKFTTPNPDIRETEFDEKVVLTHDYVNRMKDKLKILLGDKP